MKRSAANLLQATTLVMTQLPSGDMPLHVWIGQGSAAALDGVVIAAAHCTSVDVMRQKSQNVARVLIKVFRAGCEQDHAGYTVSLPHTLPNWPELVNNSKIWMGILQSMIDSRDSSMVPGDITFVRELLRANQIAAPRMQPLALSLDPTLSKKAKAKSVFRRSRAVRRAIRPSPVYAAALRWNQFPAPRDTPNIPEDKASSKSASLPVGKPNKPCNRMHDLVGIMRFQACIAKCVSMLAAAASQSELRGPVANPEGWNVFRRRWGTAANTANANRASEAFIAVVMDDTIVTSVCRDARQREVTPEAIRDARTT